jgi:hypothetical protein
MPDHAHAILSPNDGIELARIMKGIKGVSARLINEGRRTRGPVWQDESFDRIIRNAAEFNEKLNYIANNAVKAELAQEPFDYPALYVAPQECWYLVGQTFLSAIGRGIPRPIRLDEYVGPRQTRMSAPPTEEI